ncbi:MAG: glycosyltransferase family 39 protein [Anaerolineae bacterium]|nr:glycosyltransferase family 39 protein [Anaerolineae bacterium]
MPKRLKACHWTRWGMVLLVAAAFALYLHNLGDKSLWSDEGLTFCRAEQPVSSIFCNLNLIPTGANYYDGAGPVGETIPTPDLHPPFYFLALHFWLPLAGQSEFALRFPSAAAAVLALPLFYTLGRRLLSREAGFWAALLASSSPFYLWYAQEARMYTWVLALSLASIVALLPLLGNARRRDFLAFGLVTLLLLYTHYSGFFLLAFEGLLYAAARLRTRPREVAIAAAVLLVALIPLAPYLWRTVQLDKPFAFGYHSLDNIAAEAISSFSLGLGESFVRPLWQVAPFLAMAAIGALMLDARQRQRAWAVILGYLLLPALIQYALSFVRPNYMNPRHLIVISPAWELLVAQGLTTMRRRSWPGLAILLLVLLFLRGQACYDIFTARAFWKDDVRGAVQYIQERARPGDAVVLHSPVIRLTFDYYYDGPYPETVIPHYHNSEDTERAAAELAAWSQEYDRIWFLYGPPPTYFPQDFLPNWADTHLFKVYQEGFESWWTYVAVAAYDDGPPLLDRLPDGVQPMDRVEGSLQLAGLQVHHAAAGESGWLDLYWQVRGNLPDRPLVLAVKLRDAAGFVWWERTEEVLPFYPLADWPVARLVQTEFRLPLPDDMPPIAYTIEVEPIGLRSPMTVGTFVVSRPAEPPTAAAPPCARFTGDVELLAADLADGPFRAGAPLWGTLTWRAAAAPSGDYRLRVRLTDLLQREVASAELLPSAAGFPTTAWQAGDQVAGQMALPLPSDLPSGLYRVQVALSNEDGDNLPLRCWYGSREWATVGLARVEALPISSELPPTIDHRLEDTWFGEAVRLRGYDLEREGDELTVTLYWQAEAPPDGYYHVFVHVWNPGQPPVAQDDSAPVNWTRPTTTWRAGEVIVDPHLISLSGAPPGRYQLTVGLYVPDGPRLLPVVQGELLPDGYVLLQEIEIGE